MNSKSYPIVQRNAAYDWLDKWFELSGLIIEVTSTDEPPYSAPVPTELDEINYQRLRFWLIEHEDAFVPLWQDFYACQDWVVKDDNEESDDLTNNPFSCLYEPENLYHLAKELELQSGIDVWEPSKQKANEANGLIVHMGKRLVEFLDWIDDRVWA